MQARQKFEKEHAVAIGEAAKVARAQRRERALATVRREEEAAREASAKVRYETRPEVRQESAALFEARRKALAEESRQKHEAEQRKAMALRKEYLDAAGRVRSNVKNTRSSTQNAREALAEARRQEADKMREQLEAERRRRQLQESSLLKSKREQHNSIRAWEFESAIE